MSNESKERYCLTGLTLRGSDRLAYDIGLIADYALQALQVAVLAVEQIVTGEKLIHSMDVGEFYRCVNGLIAEENGNGAQSEPGEMHSLADEIEGVLDVVRTARRIPGTAPPSEPIA